MEGDKEATVGAPEPLHAAALSLGPGSDATLILCWIRWGVTEAHERPLEKTLWFPGSGTGFVSTAESTGCLQTPKTTQTLI